MSMLRVKKAVSSLLVLAFFAACGAATFHLVFRSKPGKGHPPVSAPAGAKKKAPRDKLAKPEEPAVRIDIKNPEVEHWRGGKVQWSLRADQVKSDSGTGITEFSDAEGKFQRDGGKTLIFRSPGARFDENTKIAVADGGVESRMEPEGYEIKAGRLKWREKEEALTMDRGVFLKTGDGSSLKANRVESSGGMKQFRFSGGVEIELVVK